MFPNLDRRCIVIDVDSLPAAMYHRHRSHFGSRYTLGCCDIAGLFAWCDIEFETRGSLAEAEVPWATSKVGPIAAPTWTGTPKAQDLPTTVDLGHLIGQLAAPIRADSTQRSSQAVFHPSTNRALFRLTSEVEKDPVGLQRQWVRTH